jgi:hypothetical protein
VQKLLELGNGKLGSQLKAVKDLDDNNFLDEGDMKNLAELLDKGNKEEVKAILGGKDYGKLLERVFRVESTFADQKKDEAKTSGTGLYTYPVKVVIENKYETRRRGKKSCDIQVGFTRKSGSGTEPIGKVGKIAFKDLTKEKLELTVQVPALADHMLLWGEDISLRSVPLAELLEDEKQKSSSAAFFDEITQYRWRNAVLEHYTEWTEERLHALLDKIHGDKKTREMLPCGTDDKDFKRFKEMMRALTFWGGDRKSDPYGEVAVLGPKGKEISLFGEGKGQLSKKGALDHIHPVTGTWLLDILCEKELIELRKRWPAVSLLRDEEPETPLLAGWLAKSESGSGKVALGSKAFAVVVQAGYGSSGEAVFQMKSSETGKTVDLGGVTSSSA